jgi:simple sugar transport system permease protein
MAVPSAQRGTVEHISPASKLLAWLRNIGTPLIQPLFALVLAAIVSGIVILITTPGSPTDRFNTLIATYAALYTGSFGDPFSLSYTLVKVGPLILTGLSVAIAFRAGLFNIGAEGQLAVGAMTAAIIGLKNPSWPGWLLIPFMIIGSMLAGAVWGGIVGWLKAWRGAHEVVTTIMLNWIAFYLTDYLIDGPFKAPQQATQTPPIPAQATFAPITVVYNQTFGTFLPPIDSPTGYLTDTSFFLALLVLIIYWFITARTTFGYEIRVIGQNLKAARYAGIPINRNMVAVMAFAGACSGLAGAIRLMGQPPYYLVGSTFSIDTTGFDAIGVALLGHGTAIGTLLAALLFGGLRQSSSSLQLVAHVPGDIVYIIQAIVLFCIASEFLPAIQRAITRWRRGRMQAALAVIDTAGVLEMPVVVQNEDTTDNGNEAVLAGEVESSASVEHHSDRVEEG